MLQNLALLVNIFLGSWKISHDMVSIFILINEYLSVMLNNGIFICKLHENINYNFEISKEY